MLYQLVELLTDKDNGINPIIRECPYGKNQLVIKQWLDYRIHRIEVSILSTEKHCQLSINDKLFWEGKFPDNLHSWQFIDYWIIGKFIDYSLGILWTVGLLASL